MLNEQPDEADAIIAAIELEWLRLRYSAGGRERWLFGTSIDSPAIDSTRKEAAQRDIPHSTTLKEPSE